jgi:uncharacterized repeat protein (TIGR03803 family)
VPCTAHELRFPAGWLLAVIATVVSICAVVVPASAQSYTILFNFPGGITGSTPRGLTIDAAGRLYGATLAGGNGGGTVFRLSRAGSGWVLTTLYPFRGTTDGSTPGMVVFGPDGALYGATSGDKGDCFLVADNHSTRQHRQWVVGIVVGVIRHLTTIPAGRRWRSHRHSCPKCKGDASNL